MQHNELLPPCDGPKMHPFGDPNPKIKFEERLDDEEEGYVFKVNINSQPFALKVFPFFNVLEARGDFTSAVGEEISDEVFEEHVDPFYAECRAYGRINEFYQDAIPGEYEKMIREFFPEKPQRGIVAAQCYGYLHLSSEDEEYLNKSYTKLNWNRKGKHEGKPLRALVKQLINPIDGQNQPSTLRAHDALRTLHSIGIFPNNISPRNYRNGLLMSFSKSYTVPHCVTDVLPEVQAGAEFELQKVDRMIEPATAAVY